MKNLFIVLALLLFSPAGFGGDCLEDVKSTIAFKRETLRREGNLGLKEQDLVNDRRFRSFPALAWSWEIKHCPRLEVIEIVKDFLAEVGFSRHRMDRYFKVMAHMTDDARINVELKTREYQIGDEASRVEFVEEDLADSALRIPFFAYGNAVLREPIAVNSVIYLGDFEGQGLIAMPYHGLTLVDGKPRACEEFEYMFPGVKENPVRATRTVLSMPDVDLAFCSISLKDKTVKLKAVKWNWHHKIQKQDPLVVLGRGNARNANLKVTYDKSEECRALADESQATLYVIPEYPSSWRLPTGCDISPGDSGAAVFDRRTFEWVGFATTTTQYTYEKLADAALAGALPMDRLIDESSHIVPLGKVKEALERKKMTANSVEARFIDWMLMGGSISKVR